MSEITIFEYKDYRTYLNDRLTSSEYGRGGKASLSRHIQCQPSFVSQVLTGKSSFSLEQAYQIQNFLKHNSLQQEYFMTLVERDRAGTGDLKKYFSKKAEEIVEKSKLIENQLSYEQLSEEDTISYFNSWTSIRIRNLVEIPEFQTLQALKDKLQAPSGDFKKSFDFLVDKKLIRKTEEGKIMRGPSRLHVKKASPLAKYANISARMQILKEYDKADDNSLNYGCYMTIPRDLYDEFKGKFRKLIVEMNDRIEAEEGADLMAAFVVDFMEI